QARHGRYGGTPARAKIHAGKNAGLFARIMAHALTGLEQARRAIASNSQFDREMREKILAELDEQIASWSKDAR
ncbi:MAG: hypothetical protein AAFQ90_12815, partial [Pseudomonadota bacterium]